MNKLLLTLVDGEEHEELNKLTSWSHKVFAERNGYDYTVGGRMDNRPVSWSKIPLMQRALFELGYERVFFIDNDAVFFRFDIDPMDTLDYMNSFLMLAGEDRGVVNCGLWWIKQEARSERFLAEVDVQDWNYREPIWEQAAVHDMLGMRTGMGKLEWIRDVVICTQFFNDMYGRLESPVVRHYCGMKVKERIQCVKRDYKNVLGWDVDE